MMACLYDPQEIQKIEKIIARAKCPALGLNEHFPPAIYYGPYALGGLGNPSTPTKTTITRINYFYTTQESLPKSLPSWRHPLYSYNWNLEFSTNSFPNHTTHMGCSGVNPV